MGRKGVKVPPGVGVGHASRRKPYIYLQINFVADFSHIKFAGILLVLV